MLPMASSEEKLGANWRDAINAFRPVIARLWAGLNLREKRRFLRHLRHFWDTHRHRSPSTAFEQITKLIDSGALKIEAARIKECKLSSEQVEVSFLPRGSTQSITQKFDRVINCTGPASNLKHINNPLLSSLIAGNLAEFDQLGLGLSTSSDGQLMIRGSKSQGFIFALGPLRKGTLWESSAVPELRVQAQQLSDQIYHLLKPKTQAVGA